MNKFLFLGLLLITSVSYSQVNQFTGDVPWTVGIGINIVDNDGFRFSQPFDNDNWNFETPYSVEIGRKLNNEWAVNFEMSLNTLTKNNLQNNGTLKEDSNLFAVDATAQYTFDQYFMNTPRIDPFEAYGIVGFGYTRAVSKNSLMFDLGLGFNFWIIQDIGIRLKTMGKFGFNNYQFLKNYIQHSAEFIVRF